MKQVVLEVADVSKVIVKHILSGKSGQISIPDRAGLGSVIRALPNWLQELIRNTISMNLKNVRDALDAMACQ